MRRLALLATLLFATLAAPAGADWNGDGPGDLLAVDANGRLVAYSGDGTGRVAPGDPAAIGTGWGVYLALLAPGDFSGDGAPDLLGLRRDGVLVMHRGDGNGGFVGGPTEIGQGWTQFTALLAPGDWSGDGKPDLIARTPDGRLLLYRGTGKDGAFVQEERKEIGNGWQVFTALLAPGDFSGDGEPDILAREAGGAILLFRGDGKGGFFPPPYPAIGNGFEAYDALMAGGDFSGDGKSDVLGVRNDGILALFRGDGAGGLAGPGQELGGGWDALSRFVVLGGTAPPPKGPPPSAPILKGNRISLAAGVGCTPSGGRLRVRMAVKHRKGKPRPIVRRVVFSVDRGTTKVDRKAPYAVRLPVTAAAGSEVRVAAKVVYRRKGGKKLYRKTVSRPYAICA